MILPPNIIAKYAFLHIGYMNVYIYIYINTYIHNILVGGLGLTFVTPTSRPLFLEKRFYSCEWCPKMEMLKWWLLHSNYTLFEMFANNGIWPLAMLGDGEFVWRFISWCVMVWISRGKTFKLPTFLHRWPAAEANYGGFWYRFWEKASCHIKHCWRFTLPETTLW